MNNLKNKPKIGIIGSGPGGSILATYLGMSGIEVTVFEKEDFPRFHIGESLNPAVMHILDEINVTTDHLGEMGFAKKEKVIWTLPRKEFSHELNPKAIHVERARFDEVLKTRAVENGAKIIKAKVTEVNIESDKPIIHYLDSNGLHQQEFDFIVDASGRAALIASQLGKVKKISSYNHIAVHTRFTNYTVPKSEEESTVLHYLNEKEGWCWQFPIAKNLYSVGVVIPRSQVTNIKELESFFWETLEQRNDIKSRLLDANCEGHFRIDANYSYKVDHFTGKKYALIGDASGYIDPIFSAGIGIASHGAKFLAMDIIRLVGESKEIVGDELIVFKKKMSTGFHNWRGIIHSYYRLQVAMTYFIVHSDHSELIVKLLNGELYDEVQEELLFKISEMIKAVENNPNHPWHPFLGKKIPE